MKNKNVNNLKIPLLSTPWNKTDKIVSKGDEFYNDFCLIKDRVGEFGT